LKGSNSGDVSGCWHIISDQIPPCITGLKLAFVTMFLYVGSKANGKSVSPSGCGFIDKTVPVTVTHWFNILNRQGGFTMKFHKGELHPLEDIVELVVLLEIAIALELKSTRLVIATVGLTRIAMIDIVFRFDR
jgi:hypothetical protein